MRALNRLLNPIGANGRFRGRLVIPPVRCAADLRDLEIDDATLLKIKGLGRKTLLEIRLEQARLRGVQA
jgi:hypothetical protein